MDQVALDHPGTSEHLGILNRNLPVDHETFPRELFDHVHGVTVNRAILAEPRVIDKIRNINHHGVAFPMADGVAVIRGIECGVMLPAIRGNHAKGILFRRVHGIVEKYDLVGNLDDFGWRTDARKSFWSAPERWIFMALMRAKVFYFIDHISLVRWQIGTLQPVLQLGDFVRRLSRPLLPALGVMRLSVRAVRSRADRITPAGGRPESGEIRMPVRQMRSRSFPCSLYGLRRRFSPGQSSSVRVGSGERLVLVEAIPRGDFFGLGGSGCGLRGSGTLR